MPSTRWRSGVPCWRRRRSCWPSASPLPSGSSSASTRPAKPRGSIRSKRSATSSRRCPPAVARGLLSWSAMPRRRRVAPRPARHAGRPAPPSEAERRLLALARELGGLGRGALPDALRALAIAYAPDGPLSRAVARAFLATRGDKTGALALAWAREQVRLALQELLEATLPSAHGGPVAPPAALAWLLLAGADALAQEPASAVADRLRVLSLLTGCEAAP